MKGLKEIMLRGIVNGEGVVYVDVQNPEGENGVQYLDANGGGDILSLSQFSKKYKIDVSAIQHLIASSK